MQHRLTAADRQAPSRIGACAWQRATLNADLGACAIDHLQFSDGLGLVYVDYNPRYDLLETGQVQRERALTVTVALDGRSSNTGADGQRFDFIGGHSHIATYASRSGERCFPAGQRIRQVRLIAHEPLLERYGLADLLAGPAQPQSVTPLLRGRYSAAVQRLAQHLVHQHDQDGSLLDTHIAALSLLAEQLRPLTPPPRASHALSADDQERLLRARDILLSQYDRALTVGYLCTAVGTNEFKLKQGFRHLFGTSPYRLLTDIRMAKAWELLETGLHVATVAYRVGFQYPSSFSVAFERYYGRTPKSIARRKS